MVSSSALPPLQVLPPVQFSFLHMLFWAGVVTAAPSTLVDDRWLTQACLRRNMSMCVPWPQMVPKPWWGRFTSHDYLQILDELYLEFICSPSDCLVPARVWAHTMIFSSIRILTLPFSYSVAYFFTFCKNLITFEISSLFCEIWLKFSQWIQKLQYRDNLKTQRR